MFWPLIGGFIAFVLLTVLIGWLVDPARRRDAHQAEPRPRARPRTRA
jgi:F0F1-type ATP synthase assembly protein I